VLYKSTFALPYLTFRHVVYTLYDCGMNVYCNPAYGCQRTINVYVCMYVPYLILSGDGAVDNSILQGCSQSTSAAWSEGRQPLGAVLDSLDELGELS